MGLIDLKTDLKSLRYGKDTIGGGYSGQPYIQTPIPDSFNDLVPNEDFILRGGANALTDAATDIKRLTKMFIDTKSPNGILFIAKQNLLSQTAVRTQTTDGVNEGIYSPLNTLAQAGVVEIGGHLNKQGVNPFAETGAYANNIALYSVKVKPSQQTENNRLARLYQLVSINAADKLDGFILNNGPANVLTYSGGPNSILGAGKTNIRYSTFRTGKQNPYFVSDPDFFTGKNNQKSVDAEDKQVGGLQINLDNPWTKGGIVFTGNKKQFYFNNLPIFTPNTPQESSFTQAYSQLYNFSSSVVGHPGATGSAEGGDFSYYSPFFTGISEVNNKYDRYFYLYQTNNEYFNGDGFNRLWNASVYKPGTLEVDLQNIGPETWTPKQGEDLISPNGSNYITGKGNPLGTKYAVEKSKGVTNKFNNDTNFSVVTTFNNPSVYNPSGSNKPLLSVNDGKTGGTNIANANGTITYNQEDLIRAVPSQNSPAITKDFRKVLREKITNNTVAEDYLKTGRIVSETYIDYATQNIGAKNKLGNPGTKVKNLSKFTKGTENVLTRDLINESGIGTSWTDADKGSKNDLVTFYISNLGGGKTLNFRAFLNTFSDSYNATINSQQMVGRGENFYTYGGFNRKISLSWTVAALSREELIPMHKKLSYLASNTAPEYSANGYMKGPLIQLTVGGYLKDMPGYIESISLDYITEMPWEIAITEDGAKDNTISQLSHMIKVSSFSFIPIPNYLPERGANFIELIKGDGTGNLW